MVAPVRESDRNDPSKDGSPESGQRTPPQDQPTKVEPWARKTRRRVYEGDVTVVEMRSRPVPVSGRAPPPAAPVSDAPASAAIRRLAGVSIAAAVAGVAGYLWGFGLPLKSSQPGPPVEQAGVPPAPPSRPPVAAAPETEASSATERSAPTPLERSAPLVPAPPESREHVPSPQDRQRALNFLKKGEEMLAAGNVGAARLFYERAADEGLAEGALALATTFDPDELARRQVLGVQPNQAAARRWYERARELQASEADDRH
jgi:hypothetical protein